MSTLDTKRDSCRRHLNMLLRKKVHNPLAHMESWVDAPAFYQRERRGLIEDAYSVHHLPNPYTGEPPHQ